MTEGKETITVLYMNAMDLEQRIRKASRQRRRGNVIFWIGVSLTAVNILKARAGKKKESWK